MRSRKNHYRIVFGCAVLLVLMPFFPCSYAKSLVIAGPDGITIKGYEPVAIPGYIKKADKNCPEVLKK